MLQYVCNDEGIRIPWDKVARGLGPDYSEGAIVQHLAKLRSRMAEMGIGVPPPLKRGVLQTPSKVYALGGRSLRGEPKLITPPVPKSTIAAAKNLADRTKGRKASNIYSDDSEEDESDDPPKEQKAATRPSRKGRAKSEIIAPVEIKEEDTPRRSSARTAGSRKDYSNMGDDESGEEIEDVPMEDDVEGEHTPVELTSDNFVESDNEAERDEGDVEGGDDEDDHVDGEVKSEPAELLSSGIGTGTSRTKIVKLSVPKFHIPEAPNVIDEDKAVGPRMPPVFGNISLTIPNTLLNDTPAMGFDSGNLEFPGIGYNHIPPLHLAAPFDAGPNYNSETFNFGGGSQSGNVVTSPSEAIAGPMQSAHGLTIDTSVPARPFGSFDSAVTSSSFDTGIAPSNAGEDGMLEDMNRLRYNTNGMQHEFGHDYHRYLNDDGMEDQTCRFLLKIETLLDADADSAFGGM